MSNKPKKSRIEHLAGRDINVHHHAAGHAPAPPPADAVQVLVCPQCGQRTWRHTRHCAHCRLDLWMWHAGMVLASAAAVVPVLGCMTLGAIVRRACIDRMRRLD